MDLTFQVPMQYRSLQHWTYFITNPIHTWALFSFWPHLFILSGDLYSSPVTYWAPTDLVSSSFSVISKNHAMQGHPRWMGHAGDKTWSCGEGNGNPLQYSCLENPMNSMNSMNRITLSSSNSPSGYIPKRIESRVFKRYLYGCIIHNSQKVETTQPCINE